MISHVVLMKPRADLGPEERRALAAAFEHAVTVIPSVRAVRVGRRVTHGAGYEQGVPDTGDFLAVIDFEDLDGLQAYLRHPEHEALGRLFRQSLSAALIFDFEIGGLELLEGV